jgi:uncharacterized protein
VTVYLDPSIIVALLIAEALTARAEAFIRAGAPVLIVSDFAATEFASGVSRKVRMGEITRDQARDGFAAFDAWSAAETQRIETVSADITAAQAFLRRLDLSLRTGDAIHIAIAQRLGAALATFDAKMAASARALGLPFCDA